MLFRSHAWLSSLLSAPEADNRTQTKEKKINVQMVQQCVYYCQEGFTSAFSVLDNMRASNEGVDTVLKGDSLDDNNAVKCHSLVLSSISPYFR